MRYDVGRWPFNQNAYNGNKRIYIYLGNGFPKWKVKIGSDTSRKYLAENGTPRSVISPILTS